MSGAYSVVDDRLMHGDEELLVGPAEEVRQICAALNAADPDEHRLAPTIRCLIGMTRGCSFAVGSRLLNDGTPMIHLKNRRGVT